VAAFGDRLSAFSALGFRLGAGSHRC
jgi:hypothetical protein